MPTREKPEEPHDHEHGRHHHEERRAHEAGDLCPRCRETHASTGRGTSVGTAAASSTVEEGTMTEILREWTNPECPSGHFEDYAAGWEAGVAAAHAANPDIVLPDAASTKSDTFAARAYVNGFNDCLAEIRRLNTPAPRVRRYMVELPAGEPEWKWNLPVGWTVTEVTEGDA